MIGSGLGCTRQLRQRHDRHAELLREALERSRNRRNLGLAAFKASAPLHQLDVIDDDEAEAAVLAPLAPRARAKLERIERRRLVNQDRRLVQLAEGGAEAVPVAGIEPRVVLLPILLLHAFRHLGLMFLAPGAVYPGVPPQFAYPAAFGDLLAAVLALVGAMPAARAQAARDAGCTAHGPVPVPRRGPVVPCNESDRLRAVEGDLRDVGPAPTRSSH